MGTQQILLIVLSVIIVGAAVAVGIQMFNSQGESSARSACIMDMNNFAAMALAWYRTPASLGGAGGTVVADDKDEIAAYIDKTNATGNVISNDNGTYTITTTPTTLTIACVAKGYASVQPSLDLIYIDPGDGTQIKVTQ